MKATISLEGLLALIHGLSLSASNKRWLGEKLIEEAQADRRSTEGNPIHFYTGKQILWRMERRGFSGGKCGRAGEGNKGKPEV